jgi:hypothetical protein
MQEIVPRDITDVYKRIDSVIPDDQKHIKLALKSYIDSIWNLAPEQLRGPDTYIPFQNILITNIPNIVNLTDDDPKWMSMVRDIFCNKA